MERAAANNFVARIWNFAKNENFRLIAEQITAARSGPEWRHG